MAYRIRATGQYPVSKGELIAARPNISFPAAWGASVLDFLGVDEVFPTPLPPAPRGSFVREAAPQLTEKGTWQQVWEVVALPAEQQAELLRDAKRDRLAELAAVRWSKETGGINLGGAAISTDRESQSLVTGALALVNADPARLIDWKGAAGWVRLDADTARQIAFAVGAHVQACFSRERALAEEIDAAASFADLDAIDLQAGWPA